MKSYWIPCSVGPGQFPTEFAVSGTQADGRGFSLFAPRESVFFVGGDQEEGDGFIRVDEVDRTNDLVVVRLPARTFESGQLVRVRESTLTETVPQRSSA
jgi:hypothetical protein